MFRTLDVSTSGMVAQRTRMDTIAGNIAQAGTTQNEEGEISPFQRRLVLLEAMPVAGAETGVHNVKSQVAIDTTTPERVSFEPGHPHADKNGYVHYPNVNIVTEFVNAMEASRAYEANVNTMQISKDMLQTTFKILA